jgi:hypothetical protein
MKNLNKNVKSIIAMGALTLALVGSAFSGNDQCDNSSDSKCCPMKNSSEKKASCSVKSKSGNSCAAKDTTTIVYSTKGTQSVSREVEVR